MNARTTRQDAEARRRREARAAGTGEGARTAPEPAGIVAVLGGGVAGLTAADELSRRGYRVDVYDADPCVLGGKARSYPYSPAGVPDLPAEHGFRFFPGFYRNVFETMGGIPARTGIGTVADRLVTAEELALWSGSGSSGPHRRSLTWANLASARVGQLNHVVAELLNGGTPSSEPRPFGILDIGYLAHLLGVVALADRHKLLELEGYSFADYTCTVFPERSVLEPSPRLAAFLRHTGTRLLVAAQPGQMSARTGLVTLLRLLNPLELYTERGDRLLPGPTNREWIDPWVDDLTTVASHRQHAVTFHQGRRVTEVALEGGTVVSFTDAAGTTITGFDHVVVALPHAVVRHVLRPLPSSLAGLSHLRDGWMVGVQYFLRREARLSRGHSVHLDTPWALTSIHQGQFWPGAPLPAPVRDVLSVCVSDWEAVSPALGKSAAACSRDELLAEVWRQICDGVNAGAGPELLPADRSLVVEAEHVDEAVTFDPAGTANATPLFLNTVGSWSHRPHADIGCANLFLAGDYVRTNADLASMESANESARRAVQALLDADGFHGPPVKVATVDHLGLLED